MPPPYTSAGLRSSAARRLPFWAIALLVAGTLQAGIACGVLATRAHGDATNPAWLLVATSLTYVVASGLLLHGGTNDPRSRWLAAFFLAVASAAAQPEIRHVEAHAALRWTVLLRTETLLPFFLWRFVRDFPRVVHLSRSSHLVDVGARVSLVTGVALFGANAFAVLLPSVGTVPEVLHRDGSGSLYWPLTLGSAVAAAIVALARTRQASAPERRRVKLLVWSLALGIGPGFLLVLLEQLVPAVDSFTDGRHVRFYSDFVLYVPLASIPVLAGYSVRARDVLDVRLLLHRTLASAVVSRTLWAVTIGALAALVGHVYWNPELTGGQLLALPHMPVLLLLGAASAVLLAFWKSILVAIEPSAESAHINTRDTIAAFTRETGSARSPLEVTRILDQYARDALQLESVALLTKSADGADLSPGGTAGRPLGLESALCALLGADATPIVVDPDEPHSLVKWLPRSDQEWLADVNAGMLAPISSVDGAVSGVIVLPMRSDGAPFTRNQQLLGTALTSAAALALRAWNWDTPLTPANVADRAVRECRSCGGIAAEAAHDSCTCGGLLSFGAIPRELNGRFRVERVLGRGGMGVVYLGTDLELQRTVALKTLPKVRPESLVRLRQESRSMAHFVHPHLALIFGAESWRGVPVLVMEHLGGGTLSHRLRKPAPIAHVVQWGFQLSSALDAIHRRGLLHGDVKPSNVGFSDEGTLKLLDFGLARLANEMSQRSVDGPPTQAEASSLTASHHVLGTPLYLSPEVRAGESPSPAQDLWALAVVLWEATAGCHPFGQVTPRSVLDPLPRPPDISSVRHDCPAELSLLLSEALDPERGRRPKTARVFMDRLYALFPKEVSEGTRFEQ